jgi:hypothetical protein
VQGGADNYHKGRMNKITNIYDLAEMVVDKAECDGRIATADDIAEALNLYRYEIIDDMMNFMETRMQEGGDAIFYSNALRAIQLWLKNANHIEE